MTTYTRRHTSSQSGESVQGMFNKLEREIGDGYLEVEITGMTLRRLALTYAVLLRTAWLHTLGNVRALLRPTPAV